VNVKRIFSSVHIYIFIVVAGICLIYSRYASSFVEVQGNPVLQAVALGDAHKVLMYLKKGESVNLVDNDGNTPLGFAVWNSMYAVNRNCVDILLAHCAYPRLVNNAGQPPINQVVKVDNKIDRMNVIAKLIKYGANFSDQDKQGMTVLNKILETDDYDGVDMMLDWWGRLLSPKVLNSAWNKAHQYGMRNTELILLQGVKPITLDVNWDPQAIDKRTGLSDLHCAVINNDKKTVLAILERKGNCNQASPDELGFRPLHYAVNHQHPEIVALLIEKKADINGTNLLGNTPLHMVAWINNEKVAQQIAEYLLSHGANINAKNNEGNTLLHMLIYLNNKNLIDFIAKKYKFDAHLHNNDHETAIDLATRLDRKNLLQAVKQ
jgi:ankyrin repeat protein